MNCLLKVLASVIIAGGLVLVTGCASTSEIDPERMVGEHMPEMIGGPQALYRVLRYPDSARNRGIQGQVLLNFTVNTDGRPENIKVTRGVSSDLDRAAVRAMEQVRFKPGMKDGEPIPVEMNFPVVFRLQ